MNNICLETSASGKGDFRACAVRTSLGTLDFVYQSHTISEGIVDPGSHTPIPEGDKNDASTLKIVLADKVLPIVLELYYIAFTEVDVIARASRIVNNTGSSITLKGLASLQLDLFDSSWQVISLDGAWAREREVHVQDIKAATLSWNVRCGTSSAFHNPCIFLKRPDCSQSHGEAIGINLVYSGNHQQIIEPNEFGKVRLLTALGNDSFTWPLGPGQSFATPMAVMTYSDKGLNQASDNFARFTNRHIIRGYWRYRQRPVLLNNWEATYFDFSQDKLIKLANQAKSLGIELFVLDDGWFGRRTDDTKGLGDWTANPRKLPKGIEGLAQQIHQIGMMFGIWVEPEMVSQNSELYEKHPDWAVQLEGRDPSFGRSQLLLDLRRDEVQAYIIDSISKVLENVDYMKWDMNRLFSDYPDEGFFHSWMIGLYKVLGALRPRFPKVLMEACSSGGNRFDLGMLCFFDQVWTSDDTDALQRTRIQEGTSYGYSQVCMGSHVSACPNHQSLRSTDIETRFNVAAFGNLGYELDLGLLTPLQRSQVKAQIAYYKEHRPALQYGKLYRMDTEENRRMWVVEDPASGDLLVLDFQVHVRPNSTGDMLRLYMADENASYQLSSRPQKLDIRLFGSLINRVSPIKIEDGKALQRNIAENWGMDTETTTAIIGGDVLKHAGVKLDPQFTGTGYDSRTRVLGDCGSRLYWFRKL